MKEKQISNAQYIVIMLCLVIGIFMVWFYLVPAICNHWFLGYHQTCLVMEWIKS